MDTIALGTSDLEVSEIILGCMSYGDPARGTHSWSLPEDESRPFIQRALEAISNGDIMAEGFINRTEPLSNLLEVMRYLMSHNGHMKTAIVP